MELNKDKLILRKSIAEDIILQLNQFCLKHAINSLFVVGSYCRAVYMKKPWLVNTLEITSTLFDDPQYIGFLFATEVLQAKPVYYPDKQLVSISYKDIIIEFQGNSSIESYMHNKDILDWMQKTNVQDIPLLHNIYGRNFTVNALALSVDKKELYDPTNRAVKDIERELISSLIPPHILIKNHPKAILDAIYLSLSLDFYVENKLSLAMREGAKLVFGSLSQDYLVERVVNILKIDAIRGLDMLKRFDLDGILLHPSIKELTYNAR